MTPRELDQLADIMAGKLKERLRDELPAGRLLDKPGIAAYLGVSPNHIATLGLPSLRLGQRRLYDPQACIAHLEAQDREQNRKQSWAELNKTLEEILEFVADNPSVIDEYYGPLLDEEVA